MLTPESTADEAFPLYEDYVDRLHRALRKLGVTETFLVQRLGSDDFSAFWKQITQSSGLRERWITAFNDGYEVDAEKISTKLGSHSSES